MSNIQKAFENGRAFIAFVTCGDSDLETTAKVVRAAVENGADLIELGTPFADPTAEGPVIQGANLRALHGGITTDKIFAFVKELRRDVKVPISSIVKVVRENTKVPCAIGFGISTPEQAKKMAGISDGAIVGSAIVKLIEKYGTDAPEHVAEYVKSMKDAIRS